MRPNLRAPGRIDGRLPSRALRHRRRFKMIKSHIAVRTASGFCRAVAPGRQGPRNPGERRQVLLIVPGIEIRFRLRRDIHGIEKKADRYLGCDCSDSSEMRFIEDKYALDMRLHLN